MKFTVTIKDEGDKLRAVCGYSSFSVAVESEPLTPDPVANRKTLDEFMKKVGSVLVRRGFPASRTAEEVAEDELEANRLVEEREKALKAAATK